jgi:predicted homoserine dehydrogenase-like protein
MVLTQARTTPGIHVIGVADLSVARARSQLALSCWPQERYAATSFADAGRHRTTFLVQASSSRPRRRSPAPSAAASR